MQHPTIMYSPAKPEGPWLGSLRACLGQQSSCRRSTQSPVRALPADHQATNKIKLPRRSLALAMTGLAALAPSACLAASRKGSKRKGLSIKELMDITADDVGRKKSLVTGQVDQSVYDDQLDFGDPSGMRVKRLDTSEHLLHGQTAEGLLQACQASSAVLPPPCCSLTCACMDPSHPDRWS